MMGFRARFDDFVVGCAVELEELVEVFSTRKLSEVPALLRSAEEAALAGRVVAGFVAYEAAPAFDRALTVRAPEGEAVPLAWFGVFSHERVVPLVEVGNRLEGEWHDAWSDAEYQAALAEVGRAIRAGLSYQVNVTTRRWRVFKEDPFLLYSQVATAQRAAYSAYLASDEWAVACASPELFFSIADGVVTSRPMKGTARRGRHPEEDEQVAQTLRQSPKERAENVMIVDLVRNDLGRVATFGTVSVPELLVLERYPTVWQLTSTIRAQVAPGTGLVDLFGALFPCGSVTGAPKASTMAIIAAVEPAPRGLYCGAIGRVSGSDGSLVARFAVGIRTVSVDLRTGLATYGVGGGITADSNPMAEWEEIATKARVLQASSPVGLFETLRYEPGLGWIFGPCGSDQLGDAPGPPLVDHPLGSRDRGRRLQRGSPHSGRMTSL